MDSDENEVGNVYKKMAEECIKELRMTKQQVKKMEEAEKQNDAFNCFYGCMDFKFQVVRLLKDLSQ